MISKEQALNALRENNQEHVMKFFDELSDEKKTEFLNQIENINWSDFKLIGGNEAAARGDFSVPPAVVNIVSIGASITKMLQMD